MHSADARVFRQLSKNSEITGIDNADVVVVGKLHSTQCLLILRVAADTDRADRFVCPVCNSSKPLKDRIPDMYCSACNVFFRTQTQSYLKKHRLHPLGVKRKRRDAFELLIQGNTRNTCLKLKFFPQIRVKPRWQTDCSA